MNLYFPHKGQHKGFGAGQQPPGTAYFLKNVRPFDTLDTRLRGGQRPGLDKWGSGTLIGDAEQPIVALTFVSSVV